MENPHGVKSFTKLINNERIRSKKKVGNMFLQIKILIK